MLVSPSGTIGHQLRTVDVTDCWSSPTLRWLRYLLEHHAGYLMSCPDLVTVLTPLLSLMSSRTSLLAKVSQLSGRLDLMLGELKQRNQQPDPLAAELPANEALLVYHDGNRLGSAFIILPRLALNHLYI